MHRSLARWLLGLGLIGFLVDGTIHEYTWPGKIFQPRGTERLIRVLWTHSREGADTWAALACLLFLLWIWIRERMDRDDQTEE